MEGQAYKYMLVFCLLYSFSPFLIPGWTGWRRRCWAALFRAEVNWSELMVISFPQTIVLYFQPYATSVAVLLLWKKKVGGKHKDAYMCIPPHTHNTMELALYLWPLISLLEPLWPTWTSLSKHNILYTIQYILSCLLLVNFLFLLPIQQKFFLCLLKFTILILKKFTLRGELVL